MYKNIYYQREKNLIHLWDDVRGYTTFPYTRYAYQRAQNGPFKSIFGDTLTKIYKFQKDDPELFESDVPETTRVLVDMYSSDDLPGKKINVFTFDIEVEMESGLPDTQEATNAITAIAYHDSISNEYVALVVDNDNVMEQKQTEKALVLPFATEEELLIKFIELYENINPDIITGWNIDFFDMPYIYNRLKNVLGEPTAKRLSPIGEVFWSPYRQRYFFAGVSSLDYMNIYKKFTFGELPNYRLDTVGRKEINMGKIEYQGNLDDLFRTDVDKFVEYNLVDVEIVVGLDKKLQYIDLVRGITHIGHVPYEDFVYSSKYLEGSMLTYLRRKGLVAPNKPADRRERMAAMKEAGAEKFIGAYVKDPIVGKYNWVYDLDLTSLYPSIIMTLNISPETKVGKIDDWDASEFLSGAKESYQFGENTISKENLGLMLDEQKLSISSNGVMYQKEEEGCVPGILSDWFDKRVEYKNKMKKFGKAGDDDQYKFWFKRQLVQKTLLNSFYGVLGLPAFRFYDIDNAEAVTTTGQTVIKSTADITNVKYNKEIYSNERIEIESESGETQRFHTTEYVGILRNGKPIEVMARDLQENDEITPF